jgi:sensor histidine kinase YesM
MKLIQHFSKKNKVIFHLVFSIVVLAFLTAGMYLLYVLGFRYRSLISAFTDCLFFLLCIYTGRWLCREWYLKKKFTLFVIYTLLTIILLAVCKWLLFKYAFNNPYAGFFELSREVMPFFLIGLGLGILLKIIRSSIQKELFDAHIKTEQKAVEFNLLQSQLSPHFLFNVLNNLYGIAIEEQQRIPALLLKLSSLLRYSVYSGKKNFVPLKEELEYIHNYLNFEQIRISDRLILKTSLPEIIDPATTITPMILIVFVENAFKHAKNTLTEKVYISIALKLIDNFIYFSVVNSFSEHTDKNDVLDTGSGIGLANTIKRLSMLYGDDYTLKQYQANDQYHIDLILKIKNR